MTYQINDPLNWWRRAFSLDLRSIALFRVLLALLILTHLLQRIPHLSTLYTDAGVLDRGAWLTLGSPLTWSLHAASGQLWWQVTLFAFAIMLAAGLLIGYRARLMAIGSFVLLVSLFNRNPVSLPAGESLLMVMSFWSLFLPLNARWSVDAALLPNRQSQPNAERFTPDGAQRYFSMATIAVVVQLGLVYVFSAIHWLFDRTSFESLPPFNSLSAGVAADVAALSILMPSAFWVSMHMRRQSSASYQRIQNITIYYDEDCGFCLKMCLILREMLLHPAVPIVTAQSDTAIYAIMERHNSWVIKHGDTTYIHWHAMQFLFSQRWPFKMLGWVMKLKPLMSLGNKVYRWIAINRFTMSQVTARVIPWRKISLQPSRTGAVIAAFFILVVLVYNLTGLPGLGEYRPAFIDDTAQLTGLTQQWHRFSR